MKTIERGRAVRVWVAVALFAVALGCGRDDGSVRGSGTVEMDEVDLASLTGGRITRLTVVEGDSVHAGDTLVVLDRGEVVAGLAAQRALAVSADAELRDLTAGARPDELAAARAELDAAKAQAALAQAEAERVVKLHASATVSDAERDRAVAARDAAIARREQAAHALALLEAGTRSDRIAAAREAAIAARAQRDAASSLVRELVLESPITGVVLSRNLLPGEVAPPGQAVLTLGSPDSLWMRVYIAAPKIGRVTLGAAAEVTSHALPGKRFPARVVEIARRAEFTPRAALTEEEQANLVFAVKLAIAPTGGVLKAGLPADARIEAAP